MATLTSMGMINCLGSDCNEIWKNLRAGSIAGFQFDREFLIDGATYLGMVSGDLPQVPEDLADYQARYFALVFAALRQISAQIEASIERYGASRVGVVVGSSTSGIHSGEEAYIAYSVNNQFPAHYHYHQQEMGGVSEFIMRSYGLEGPCYTISTACTSGAKSLAAARRLISLGICDAVVTGGVDSLCKLTVRGFNSLGLVSEERCNPFSVNRNGLNLGEGACLFVMEREGKGVRLEGVGETSDAHHMSAPHPEGTGVAEAMSRSLEDAEIEAKHIDYVNLHGTGTGHNDAAESIAVSNVLGAEVPVSSTKGMTGHLLGAAGSTEAGFCYMVLTRSRDGILELPPHCWDGVADPSLPKLRFVNAGTRVPRSTRSYLLSISAAFGGSNCALVFSG